MLNIFVLMSALFLINISSGYANSMSKPPESLSGIKNLYCGFSLKREFTFSSFRDVGGDYPTPYGKSILKWTDQDFQNIDDYRKICEQGERYSSSYYKAKMAAYIEGVAFAKRAVLRAKKEYRQEVMALDYKQSKASTFTLPACGKYNIYNLGKTYGKKIDKMSTEDLSIVEEYHRLCSPLYNQEETRNLMDNSISIMSRWVNSYIEMAKISKPTDLIAKSDGHIIPYGALLESTRKAVRETNQLLYRFKIGKSVTLAEVDRVKKIGVEDSSLISGRMSKLYDDQSYVELVNSNLFSLSVRIKKRAYNARINKTNVVMKYSEKYPALFSSTVMLRQGVGEVSYRTLVACAEVSKFPKDSGPREVNIDSDGGFSVEVNGKKFEFDIERGDSTALITKISTGWFKSVSDFQSKVAIVRMFFRDCNP